MPHVTRMLSKIAIIMSFCPEQFFREHRYCFFATSFLKYSPCRSTPLQLYWESQSSYGWFYATNPSPHDRITAFSIGYKENSLLHEVNATIKRSTDSPYRKKRDRKIDVAPRHSRSEPVLFRKIILDGHDIACMKTEDMAKRWLSSRPSARASPTCGARMS